MSKFPYTCQANFLNCFCHCVLITKIVFLFLVLPLRTEVSFCLRTYPTVSLDHSIFYLTIAITHGDKQHRLHSNFTICPAFGSAIQKKIEHLTFNAVLLSYIFFQDCYWYWQTQNTLSENLASNLSKCVSMYLWWNMLGLVSYIVHLIKAFLLLTWGPCSSFYSSWQHSFNFILPKIHCKFFRKKKKKKEITSKTSPSLCWHNSSERTLWKNPFLKGLKFSLNSTVTFSKLWRSFWGDQNVFWKLIKFTAKHVSKW